MPPRPHLRPTLVPLPAAVDATSTSIERPIDLGSVAHSAKPPASAVCHCALQHQGPKRLQRLVRPRLGAPVSTLTPLKGSPSILGGLRMQLRNISPPLHPILAISGGAASNSCDAPLTTDGCLSTSVGPCHPRKFERSTRDGLRISGLRAVEALPSFLGL